MNFKFWKKKSVAVPDASDRARMITVDDMLPAAFSNNVHSPWDITHFDGDKFSGGFGPTELQLVDYWTLRARSSQLFNENLYARGIIRRLVTNEINTGLHLEANIAEGIIGLSEESANDWAENVETAFELWGKDPNVCDIRHERTFGAIQRAARAEALIAGDVLVRLKQSRRTGLPEIQLISGNKVRSPFGPFQKLQKGHKVLHGVETDRGGRKIAYWIIQDDGKAKRLPAFGEKSGKRIAWLVYGTDKRLDDLRGQPLLSIVLQSLKEIDRYRDSVQRKAVVNSILAMFIKKGEDKMGSLPVSGGAVRRDIIAGKDEDGAPTAYKSAALHPGMIFETLQHGEEPVGFSNAGTDEKFGEFEEAIIQGVAWANEIPPEILRLSFSNNYSASQAAINEFRIYINRVWSDWGETFCTPIYTEWLLAEVLRGTIAAPGFLEAWRSASEYLKFGAWTRTDWYGSIKPSTDMVKQGKASELLIALGLSTRAREARITTGTKYSRNIKSLKRENELWTEAQRPIAEFKKEFGDTDDEEKDAPALELVEAVDTLKAEN